MTVSFEAIRNQHQRHLELFIRSPFVDETLPGNPANMVQGIDKILGYASSLSGIPFPTVWAVKTADTGVADFTLGFAEDAEPFFLANAAEDGKGEDGRVAMVRLSKLAMLMPIKFFGIAEAIQWLQLAGLPSTRHLLEAALDALNDPTGYQAFTTILLRLVEERVPLLDVKSILETVAAAPVAPGEEALFALTEKIRVAIRESSAKYYTETLGINTAFRAAPDLLKMLDTPEGAGVVSGAIAEAAKAMGAAFFVVTDLPEYRRAVRDLCEDLYRKDLLYRPAIVVSSAEIPSEAWFPEATREIGLAWSQGV